MGLNSDDSSITTDLSSTPQETADNFLCLHFFCDGGVLELSSTSVDAELFLVDSTPSLNDTNDF